MKFRMQEDCESCDINTCKDSMCSGCPHFNSVQKLPAQFLKCSDKKILDLATYFEKKIKHSGLATKQHVNF
jgi:hypothetical protein